MLALLLVLAALTPFQESLGEIARSKAKDPQKLHRLFDLAWQYDNAEHPELATSRGVPGHNHRWADDSLEAIERRKRETVSLGQALSAIDRRKLDANDQLNYDLFRRNVDDDLAQQRFPRELLAITQLAGPQYLSSTLDIMPARTARDYQDIVARLEGIPPELRADAVRIYREKIVPAYKKLREYFVSEYLPHARETIALSALPDG